MTPQEAVQVLWAATEKTPYVRADMRKVDEAFRILTGLVNPAEPEEQPTRARPKAKQ
jgi:hypothetical protein